jgi:hypothetical protein
LKRAKKLPSKIEYAGSRILGGFQRYANKDCLNALKITQNIFNKKGATSPFF